jgi:hypothetical protein
VFKGACRFVASGERILSIHITHPTATALTYNSSISSSSSGGVQWHVAVMCAATAGACGLCVRRLRLFWEDSSNAFTHTLARCTIHNKRALQRQLGATAAAAAAGADM